MSVKRKISRSKDHIEYVHTTDENGDDILIVKKGDMIVDVVKLFTVNKNANGENIVTLKEDDGVERTLLVTDLFKDAKKVGGEVKFLKEDEFGIKEQ